MGASIELLESREVGGEPVADIRVKSSPLNATQIDAKTVPRLVDEIPVLAVAMAHAEGTSSVRGAAELRVKESDRIETTLGIIDQLGVRTQEFEDGFSITGSAHAGRRSIDVDADGDHRTAMSAIIAAMAGEGVSVISGCECIETSFPGFWTLMETLRG
jgi:3-phosphoshikimate 1-carboxyvinyltransferase